eukprot:432575_1
MSTSSRSTDAFELIVWYYVRNQYEDKFNKIDFPMALKYLMLQFSKIIIGSKLLTTKEDMSFVQILSSKILNIKQFKLLFRASENGYLASTFHTLCDGKVPTICIVKSDNGNIFGGYTSIKWKSYGCDEE